MSTLNELLAAHPVAGARYAAAVAELKDAFVDLAAIEMTLTNGNVAGGKQRSIPTFQAPNPELLDALRHPAFAPNVGAEPGRNWWSAVKASHEAKLAAYPTPNET